MGRPMVALLGALRALPEVVSHLLHGEPPPHPEPWRSRTGSFVKAPKGEVGEWATKRPDLRR